ncbi:MAG: TlpA family protein disulfide reductase [Chlorobiaceae bacterium]|nr:TlpA family protein disulfide reductase [Chlorobiaceae bacterium]
MNIVRSKIRGALLLLLLCLGYSGSAFALEKGTPAPDFQLPGTQGTVRLSGASGSVVYLDFWASWCGPCRQSFPWMNEMQEKYRSKGLKVIAVNLDAKNEDAVKFLAQNAAKFTVAFDSKGATPGQYGVKGMPTSFLIGRDGRVISSHLGFKASDSQVLEKDIKTALEAK